MKRILLYFGFLVTFLFASNEVDATHIMGGEVTWECNGSNQYIFKFSIYRDCSGNALLPNLNNFDIYNYPNVGGVTSLTVDASRNVDQEIAPKCRQGAGVTYSCANGDPEVVFEYIRYTQPITLNGVPPADGWVITYDDNARNANNNIGQTGITIRAKIFAHSGSIAGQCQDNSPQFREKATSLLCTGSSFTYNHNATDDELDSLVYEWGRPLSNNVSAPYNEGTNPSFLNFTNGFSFTNPFPGPEVLNSATGEISLNPPSAGKYVSVVKVSAYKCGEKVAEIFRELQSNISSNCSPNQTVPTLNAPFQDQSGAFTLFNDTVRAGDLVTFNIQASDFASLAPPYLGDSVTLTATGLQFGTNFSSTTGCNNPPCATLSSPLPQTGLLGVTNTFTWQTDCNHVSFTDRCISGQNTYVFVITATDDECPIPAINIATISVTVVGDTVIQSPDVNCVNVANNGDVTLDWDLTPNINNSFTAWMIYSATDRNGPFTLLDSVKTYSTNTYTHVGANANTQQMHYVVRSRSGCKGIVQNIARDTVSTIFLGATTNPTNVSVNWNSISNPNPGGSASQYRVFREYPIGSGFNLYQNTAATSLTETFTPCEDDVNYRVELVNTTKGCTSSSNELNYTFKFPDPQTDFTFPNNQCPNTPITFSNQTTITGGTIAYSWDFGDGSPTSTQTNPTHTYASAGIFNVTLSATSGQGCDSILTQQILVTLPTADAGADQSVCPGGTASIGSGTIAGSTYAWSPAAGLSSTSISNPTATPASTTTYTVTVTDANGCTNTDQITITVVGFPVADAGANTSVCLGSGVTIGGAPTGPAGATYLWSPATGLSSATAANPVASPTTNTTYTVTVTIGSGTTCSATDQITVSVNSLPNVDAGNAQTICSGANATIGGSPTSTTPGVTYAWSNAVSLSNASIANPIATPNITTTYTVTVTDANGCTATDQVVVNVNALPVANAGVDQQICGTGSVNLGGSPTGPVGSTFAWSPATGLSSSTAANPSASPTSTTTYTVIVTDANGCTSTDNVLITVDNLPSADAGSNQSLCIGESRTIGGAPTGPGGATFAWSSSIGSFTSSSANPSVSPTSTRTYTVTVTSANGCTATDNVVLTVNPLPSADAGPNQVICDGTPVQIGGTPTTTSVGSTFQWDNAASLTSSTSANPIASPTITTTYTVTVTSITGCTATDQVLVTVNSNPTADAGLAQTICNGENATLGGAPTGPLGSTFQWDNAGTLNDATAANPVANPTVTTTYSVTVTSGVNCTTTDNITITVLPVPGADAGADQTICFGDPTPIGGSPTSATTGVTYAWNNAVTLNDATISNPIASPTTTTTYTVTVTAANGCTSTDQVVINVNALPAANAGPDLALCNGSGITIGGSPTGPPGATFLWDNAATLSSSTVSGPTASPTITTTYSVTVTDVNGCTDVDQMTVNVSTLPTANAGADQTICENETVLIGGSPTSLTGVVFNWDNAATIDNASLANPNATPLVTTTYTVTVTDAAGCSQTDQVTITVIPNPVADAGTDQTICNGNPVQIGGAPTSTTPGATFAWDNATTLTDATVANPLANPTSNTIYTVTVTHPNGCTSTDDVLVSVNGLPTADAGVDFTICNGDSRILGGSPTGPTGATFQWDNATSLDDATTANPTATPTATTTYTVTITDGNGCTNTDQVLITVLPLADVDAGPDRTICEGLNTPIGGAPTSNTVGVTIAWNNAGTLSDATIANPIANPITTTTYTVTVTNPNGCTSTDQMQVIVNPAPITDAGVDQDLCINSSTTIGGSPTGPAGSTFVWDNAGSLDDATLANPTASPLTTTIYSVTVTDVNGCTNTDNVTITVNPLPTVDAGLDQTICNGETANLGGTPTGPVGASYLWDNASTLSNPTSSNPIATPTATTTYSVTVTDLNGCVNTDQVVVTVLPLPNVDAGADQDICNLQSVTIGGAPTSSTVGVTYAWDNAASLNDATASNPIATPSVTTRYRVTVTETATGCDDTASVLIRVNPLPVVDFTTTSLCLNDFTQFTDASVLSSGTISSWTWDFGDGVGVSNLQSPTYQYAAAGTYQVKLIVSTAIGCGDSVTKPVVISPLPNVNAGVNQTICNTANVTIGGSPTSSTLGVTYAWDNGATLNDVTSANPVANPSVTTRYKVTVTETATGCFDTASVVVNVNPIPVVDFNASATCINELTSFTDVSSIVTGSLQSWTWDFGDGIGTSTIQSPTYQYSTAGSYQVKLIVESDLGCRDSITKTVDITPIPVVDFTFLNECLNDITSFADASSIPAPSALGAWSWDFGDGVGTASTQNATYTYTAAGTYTVKLVVESAVGCKDSISKTVTINPLPTADAGVDQIICNTGTAQIGGSPTSSTANVSYLWDNAGSLNDATLANPIASPVVTTRYRVTVTENTTGCFDTSSVVVSVNPIPIVDFTVADTCIGNITLFTDASAITVGSITNWTWDFGDGIGTSNSQSPSYTYAATGTYAVKLIAQSAAGCLDSLTKNITIVALPNIDAGLDQEVCLNDSVAIGGAPTSTGLNVSYAWDNAGSLNDNTLSNPFAKPLVTTRYKLTVTDNNTGCFDTSSVVVTVNPLPVANFRVSQVCLNESTQFTDLSNIVAPSFIQSWNWDFGDGTGVSTMQNPTYTYGTTGTFTAKLLITSSSGCLDSITRTVIVDTLPTANAGADRVICELETTLLGSAAVVGETYLWDNGGTLDDVTLAQPTANPTVTTTYSVTVTNTNGCSSVDDVIVSVTAAPNVDAGADVTICNGESTSPIGGTPTSTTIGVTYLWDNAATLDDATSPNPIATPSDTTRYIVTVTETATGCSATDTVFVNVIPSTVVDFTVDARCERDFAAFTDVSSAIQGNIISWAWDFGDGVGTSTLQNPGYQYASPGTYTVTLTVQTDLGCTNSFQRDETILPLPSALAGPDTAICFGDTVILGGNPTSEIGASYSWSPAFDLSSVTDSNPRAYPISATTYYLTVTGANGCFNYDTVEVDVNALPIVTAEKDTSLCVDQPVQLSAQGALTYSWSPAQFVNDATIANPVARALKSTNFVVAGTDLNGCVATDTVFIDVFNLDFTPVDTSICSGDTVVLQPVLQGDTNGITYSWSTSNMANILSDVTDSAVQVTAGSRQYFELEITNALGCVDRDGIYVNMKQAAEVDFDYVNSPRCSNSVVEINNISTFTDTYTWILNGEMVSEERNPEFEINNLVDNVLTLVGTNSTCVDSTTEVINAAGLESLFQLKNNNVFTPNGDGLNDIFNPGFEGEFIGCAEYQIFNRWGDKVFDSNIGRYGWDGITLRGEPASVGMYYYIITIADEVIKGSVFLNR